MTPPIIAPVLLGALLVCESDAAPAAVEEEDELDGKVVLAAPPLVWLVDSVVCEDWVDVAIEDVLGMASVIADGVEVVFGVEVVVKAE